MEEIAEVYARALFEAADEAGVLDRVHDELDEFADALDQDRNLQLFFFSPYFSSEEKAEGVERLVSDADEHTVNFLEAARGAPPDAGPGPDQARVQRPLGRARTSCCR